MRAPVVPQVPRRGRARPRPPGRGAGAAGRLLGGAFALGAAAAACGAEAGGPAAIVGLAGGSLVKVDAQSDEASAPERVSRTPNHLDSDGKVVWFVQTSPVTNTLFRYDLDTGTERSIVLPDGTSPADVAIGGGALWVAGGNDSLLRVDPAQNTVAMSIGLNTEATSRTDTKHLAFGHGSLWVTSATGKKKLVRVDPAKNAVAASIELPEGGVAVGVAAGEGAVFVATRAPSILFKVDPGKNQVTQRLMLEFEPPFSTAPMAVGLGGVFIVDVAGRRVVRVAAALDKTEPWDLGQAPGGVAVGRGSVWVAIRDERTELRRMVGGDTKSTYTFGSAPVGLAAVP